MEVGPGRKAYLRAKAPFSGGGKRAKAEALAYLEARTTADPCGMTTKEQATAEANAGFFVSLRKAAFLVGGSS
jgi:hypothetical protein